MNSPANNIASGALARLSPAHAKREIAWLLYKIEMDFFQDLHDRTEVYRQHVANALPDLHPEQAAMLALIWEDCEERIRLKWDKPEPPNPDREAELRRRSEALAAQANGDISALAWFKTLRAPHDPIEEPDFERVREILRAIGKAHDPGFTEMFSAVHEAYRTGEYDEYILQRGAGMWPAITTRRPNQVFTENANGH